MNLWFLVLMEHVKRSTCLLVSGDGCGQTYTWWASACGGNGTRSSVQNVPEQLRLGHWGVTWEMKRFMLNLNMFIY